MIKKLKWNNYLSLGKLELDFSKPDGTVYNTIVLAGENGTGKTTILETLSSYLNKETLTPFEYIGYIIDGKAYRIIPDIKFGRMGFHIRVFEETGEEKRITSGKNNNEETINDDEKDLRHYGFVYSKARSGFKTDPVKSDVV